MSTRRAPAARWSDLTWLEQWFVAAARRRCNELTAHQTGNPNPEASAACHQFLVEEDPVYTQQRAHADLMWLADRGYVRLGNR